MKKVLTIVIVVILLLLIILAMISFGFNVYTFFQYNGWQTISIENCGTLNIPNDWLYFEEDGLLYITDQNYEPIMIETRSDSGYDENDPGVEESNKYFESIVNLQTLTGTVLSNSASYGETLMMRSGEESKNYYLDIGFDSVDIDNDRRVLFIVWDETIDDDLVEKIAKSFAEYLEAN